MMQTNELNGTGAIRLPDRKATFATESGTFRLCLVEAMRKLGEIGEACKDRDDFSHLEQFRAWVKEETGVSLTLGEADAAWDEIHGLYAEQKKTTAARLISRLSTGSAPSASPGTSTPGSAPTSPESGPDDD